MTKRYTVITPAADLRETPDNTALRGKLESELVFGEEFIAEKEQDGWLYGACAHDGYTGWMEKKNFALATHTPEHVVFAQRSDIYAEPTIRSPIITTLSIGSKFTIDDANEHFLHIKDLGWISSKHFVYAAYPLQYPVSLADLFSQTPYRWGGRSGFGSDCSGLIQVVLGLCGLQVPRDTEQQSESIGKDVTGETPLYGDIVFFKGHVGIMCAHDLIIHANAHHMKTRVEPLAEVTERSGGITRLRRV